MEREKLIQEHNRSVRESLKRPDEDDKLADSLTERLLDGGSISFGGTVSSGNKRGNYESKSSKRGSRKLGTSRGKKR